MPSESINSAVSSPAYWLQRDYDGGAHEIGKESTMREYIDNLLQVIDEIYRVLKPNGTFFEPGRFVCRQSGGDG